MVVVVAHQVGVKLGKVAVVARTQALACIRAGAFGVQAAAGVRMSAMAAKVELVEEQAEILLWLAPHVGRGLEVAAAQASAVLVVVL